MALLFMEGFDHLAATSSDLQMKWTGATGSSTLSLVAGRLAGNALQIANTTNFAYILRKDAPVSHTVVYIGFGVRSTFSSAGSFPMVQFLDSGTVQAGLYNITGSGGQLAVYRGVGVAQLWLDTVPLASNAWNYIECRLTIDPTVGTIDVRVNGTSHAALTGQNTRATANSSVNGFNIGAITTITGNPALQFDDLYFCNGATGLGAISGGFIGDRRVATMFPSGNGFYSQFARTGGTSSGNWTAVSEAAEDGDTSYVQANTSGTSDSYLMSLPTTIGTVSGVQFNQIARKDDAGAKTIAVLQRSAGVDHVATASRQLPASYGDVITLSETSFATGSAWTASEIGVSEFGTRVAS